MSGILRVGWEPSFRPTGLSWDQWSSLKPGLGPASVWGGPRLQPCACSPLLSLPTAGLTDAENDAARTEVSPPPPALPSPPPPPCCLCCGLLPVASPRILTAPFCFLQAENTVTYSLLSHPDVAEEDSESDYQKRL